jgi:hypothetical protein
MRLRDIPVRTSFIVAAYATASLVSLFAGNSLIASLPRAVGAILVAYCVLGPLAFLDDVIWFWKTPSMGDWSFGVTYYCGATVLLACCLVLMSRRNKLVRFTGYGVAAVIWVLSGYMNFYAHYMGPS